MSASLALPRAPTHAASVLDAAVVRAQFPIFARNPGLVFLDTAASAQKPDVVIDGVAEFYRTDYANIHRGVYSLSERSTARYDAARATTAQFLNAADPSEIVFVRGATEAVNLIAQTWGTLLQPGDEVLISGLEHHANIVPWQMLRERQGIVMRVAPNGPDGGFDLAALAASLTQRTRLVSVTHVANVTGEVLPVADIARLAHAAGAKLLVDGCQAAPRLPVDVQAIGCDFYVLSGHKCYGPSGIGALYARREVLDAMPPWQGGGDMIDIVTYEKTTYQPPPARFEAGTPDISGAVGLDIALQFIMGLGREAVRDHEAALTVYARAALGALPGVRIIGGGAQPVGVVSFIVDGVHPHDLATILNQHGVAIRAGNHCAQPLIDSLGLSATARASFGVYSDESDIDALVDAVQAARSLFGCG